jgi:hypothetical protein
MTPSGEWLAVDVGTGSVKAVLAGAAGEVLWRHRVALGHDVEPGTGLVLQHAGEVEDAVHNALARAAAFAREMTLVLCCNVGSVVLSAGPPAPVLVSWLRASPGEALGWAAPTEERLGLLAEPYAGLRAQELVSWLCERLTGRDVVPRNVPAYLPEPGPLERRFGLTASEPVSPLDAIAVPRATRAAAACPALRSVVPLGNDGLVAALGTMARVAAAVVEVGGTAYTSWLSPAWLPEQIAEFVDGTRMLKLAWVGVPGLGPLPTGARGRLCSTAARLAEARGGGGSVALAGGLFDDPAFLAERLASGAATVAGGAFAGATAALRLARPHAPAPPGSGNGW